MTRAAREAAAADQQQRQGAALSFGRLQRKPWHRPVPSSAWLKVKSKGLHLLEWFNHLHCSCGPWYWAADGGTIVQWTASTPAGQAPHSPPRAHHEPATSPDPGAGSEALAWWCRDAMQCFSLCPFLPQSPAGPFTNTRVLATTSHTLPTHPPHFPDSDWPL